MVGSAFVDYHAKYGQEAAYMYSELFKMTTYCKPEKALKFMRHFLENNFGW
jgi:hypothetical protein